MKIENALVWGFAIECGQDVITKTGHQAPEHFDVLRFVVDNENFPGSRVTHRLLSLPLEHFADLRPSVSEVNGLCRNAIPGLRTPCWTMASSVYPDM